MSISAAPPEPIICNTTPTRIFALVDRFDLLVSVCAGEVVVPRAVLDPDDDPDGPADLQSEIARAERYWEMRSRAPDAMECWFRLRARRTRTDIRVVELTDDELVRFAELQSREIQRRFALAARLGPGEAAVMAIAEARRWTAAIDDAKAREVMAELSPGSTTVTTRELVRRAVYMELLDSTEADVVYNDMLDKGYRGPPLWS
jgi:predicted nucleic acid-binding protein